MSTPIKVAHVTLTMKPGGIENFVVSFARSLRNTNFKFTMVCLDGGGDLLDDIHSSGFRSFVLNRRPGLDWRLVISLVRIFSREKFDIVHTHNEAAHFYAGLAARLSRVPCLITTEHSRHYIDDAHMRRRLQKFLMSRITDRWVTVSEELARVSVERDGLALKKLSVIPNGIDVERFMKPDSADDKLYALRREIGVPEKAKIVIMVARLHPLKNHEMLIQAMAEIKDQNDNVHVILAGDGEMRDQLVRLTQSLGLGSIVHFLGYKQDVRTHLWLSDVFVLCSKTEGMPLSLLEAMAARVPLIITRTANKAELITDGVNGKVAESDVKALASALSDALRDPDKSRKMSENGFEFVREHFSLETMMNRYQGLYKEIIGERLKNFNLCS